MGNGPAPSKRRNPILKANQKTILIPYLFAQCVGPSIPAVRDELATARSLCGARWPSWTGGYLRTVLSSWALAAAPVPGAERLSSCRLLFYAKRLRIGSRLQLPAQHGDVDLEVRPSSADPADANNCAWYSD